jgi:competence transcription factor ComK
MSEIQMEIALMFNVQSLVARSQKFYNGALCCNRIYKVQ